MAIEYVTVKNTGGTDYIVAVDDIGTDQFMQVMKLGVQTLGTTGIAPGDVTNGLRVSPSVRKTRLTQTPTCSTSIYAINDQVGGLMTFTSAALVSGGTGVVTSAVITNRAANTVIPELDLYLFEASPTVASVDNGTVDLTDANLEAARALPPITFSTGEWAVNSANTIGFGAIPGGAIDFICSGSANLFGLLVARSAFTLASTTDIVVALRILQD